MYTGLSIVHLGSSVDTRTGFVANVCTITGLVISCTATLARLLHVPDAITDFAANEVQGPGPGDDPKIKYDDPPWDTAGYGLARIVFDNLTNPNGSRDFCTYPQVAERALGAGKKDRGTQQKTNRVLWRWSRGAFGGAYTPPPYPSPGAKGYKNCERCPESFRPDVPPQIAGGSFGQAGFPDSFPDLGLFW